MENTPIIHAPDILLAHLPVLGPKHDIRGHPLKRRAAPANRIAHIALPPDLVEQRPDGEIVCAARVLGEHVLELLRAEAALRVVRVAVGAVLGAVNVVQVDAEKRVWQPRGRGRVGEVDVDYDEGEEGQDHAEAQVVEADVRVARPEDAVAVAVEVLAVLLQDGLVAVPLGPVVFGGAVGRGVGGGDVGAREAWGGC